MQKVFILLVLGLAFVQSQGSWKQVWGDEFDGTSLDMNKWQFEVNCDGGGNNELQCYTARAANTKVQDGKLIITARPEQYGGKGYTSARLNTAKSASWLYGRFEMRAKLPNGKHLWPAFWMLPTDYKYGTWAASGEIDIMEYRGQVTDKTEGTLHFGGMWPNNVYQGSGPKSMATDLSAGFHTYAIEWEKDEIRWYVDQNMYHKMSLVRSFWSGKGSNPYTDVRQPFTERFHILINLAIGGGFFPAGQYGTLSPQDAANWADPTYQIDYIRAYQWTTTPVVVPSLNPPATSRTTSASKAVTSAARSTSSTTSQQRQPMDTTEEVVTPGLDNVANQNPEAQGDSKILGLQKGAMAGIVAAFGVLVIVLVVVAVVFYRRRARKGDVMSQTELAVPRFTPAATTVDLPPYMGGQVPLFVPIVGLLCKAKYSDGYFYPVTVEAVHGAQCHVNYGPKYGEEKAWVDISDMKP